MSSDLLGLDTSGPEVTDISECGIRLLVDGRELFLSYGDFPWFKDASVAGILNVEQPRPGHYHWPDLDVDLGIEAMEDPGRFPLRAKVGA